MLLDLIKITDVVGQMLLYYIKITDVVGQMLLDMAKTDVVTHPRQKNREN